MASGLKDVMLAGNADAALKDVTVISQEGEWVSGSPGFSYMWR